MLAEFWDCNVSRIADPGFIGRALLEAAKAGQATVVDSRIHEFSPQGVTGILLLTESHLSIHTWPEKAYAAIDFYTCGIGDPELVFNELIVLLEAASAEIMLIDRGLEKGASIAVRKHELK